MRPAPLLLCACVAWLNPARCPAGGDGPTATATATAALLSRWEGTANGLERALFADAADGRLDGHSLLSAAVVASGAESAEAIAACESRLAELVARMLSALATTAEGQTPPARATPPAMRRAAAVFDFLHRQVLVGGYVRDATDVRLALSSGRFNCVSGTVLYVCLAEAAGIRCRALELPTHAMVRLELPSGTLDVETTCPRWFALLDDPAAQTSLVEQTPGGARAKAAARAVDAATLAAMIYYNRGVDELAAGRFQAALSANAKALRLDPQSQPARANLLATINNAAIAEGMAGRYEAAARRLEEGLHFAPRYETFGNNYAYVHHRWTTALCDAGRFDEALAVLRRGAENHYPAEEPPAFFAALRAEIYRRWVRALLQAPPAAAIAAVAAEAVRHDDAAWREAEEVEFNRQAVALIDAERFEEAVEYLDLALGRRPEAKALRDNRLVAVMRWAEVAFQRGDYVEAIRRTTYGAESGNLHPLLENNLRYAHQQWAKTQRLP